MGLGVEDYSQGRMTEDPEGRAQVYLYSPWEITGYFQHLDKEDTGQNSEEIRAMASP